MTYAVKPQLGKLQGSLAVIQSGGLRSKARMDKAQLQSIISFSRGAAYFKGPEARRALTHGVIDAAFRVAHCRVNHVLQSTEHRSLVIRRLAKDEVQKWSQAKSSRLLIKSGNCGWQSLDARKAPLIRTIAKELQQGWSKAHAPDACSFDRRRLSKTTRTYGAVAPTFTACATFEVT